MKTQDSFKKEEPNNTRFNLMGIIIVLLRVVSNMTPKMDFWKPTGRSLVNTTSLGWSSTYMVTIVRTDNPEKKIEGTHKHHINIIMSHV
jgi:hypothetical protein